MTAPESAFPRLLREFRLRVDMSRNRLAHKVGVDPSYLTRIEHGDRETPRFYIVEAIARALNLSVVDRNRLYVAGGYAPQSVMQLGKWADALQAVTDVLTDTHLPIEERQEFEDVIIAIANRWRRPWVPESPPSQTTRDPSSEISPSCTTEDDPTT